MTVGSGGIGAGIARRVAEAGAVVVVHYRGDARGAQAVILLEAAGFRDVEVEAAYVNRPATADDDKLIFIARR